MNTTTVAKLLKVSPSTIQRWVKQLDLNMERNKLGHFIFAEEDIELLKSVQNQMNQGLVLQEVTVAKKQNRKGKAIKSQDHEISKDILTKIDLLEKMINQKADEVVSYQLLQHRYEIEELQNEVSRLAEQLNKIDAAKNETKETKINEKVIVFDETKPKRKIKKKNMLSSFFSL